MVMILLRFGLLLSVVLLFVDESPVDDVVTDVVVRLLCDNDQPHPDEEVSKTDLNKDEEDEEVLVVLEVLEVLFADCAYRGQRNETRTGRGSYRWNALAIRALEAVTGVATFAATTFLTGTATSYGV